STARTSSPAVRRPSASRRRFDYSFVSPSHFLAARRAARGKPSLACGLGGMPSTKRFLHAQAFPPRVPSARPVNEHFPADNSGQFQDVPRPSQISDSAADEENTFKLPESEHVYLGKAVLRGCSWGAFLGGMVVYQIQSQIRYFPYDPRPYPTWARVVDHA